MNQQNKSIGDIIQDLATELKQKNDKIGILDIETQKLFVDLEPKWNKLSSTEKQKLGPKLIPKMKVSIAGLLTFDKEDAIPVYAYYSDDEIKQLEKDLGGLDKIIGHNLFRFDYLVLSAYISQKNLHKIKIKTIDTWKLLRDETEEWISLNDLGKLNFGITKIIDTLKIPQMWRDGKYEEVKEYLKLDLDLLASVFYYGFSQNSIKYYEKNYGDIIGTNSKVFNWKPLID